MNMETIKKVFSDEIFLKALFEMETVAEVRAALKEKGVEMTEKEILAIRELLVKVESGEITAEQLELWQKQAEDGELSDEALEQVAGGVITLTVGLVVKTVFLAAAIAGGSFGAGYGIAYSIEHHRW